MLNDVSIVIVDVCMDVVYVTVEINQWIFFSQQYCELKTKVISNPVKFVCIAHYHNYTLEGLHKRTTVSLVDFIFQNETVCVLGLFNLKL